MSKGQEKRHLFKEIIFPYLRKGETKRIWEDLVLSVSQHYDLATRQVTCNSLKEDLLLFLKEKHQYWY